MSIAEPALLGATIRTLRVAASLSQRELGRRTGFSQPAIARLEAGRQVPTLATLRRVAVALERDFLVHIPGAPLASHSAI